MERPDFCGHSEDLVATNDCRHYIYEDKFRNDFKKKCLDHRGRECQDLINFSDYIYNPGVTSTACLDDEAIFYVQFLCYNE